MVIAWIPVLYSGTGAVMISIPCLQWVAEEFQVPEFSSKHNNVNFKDLLEGEFDPLDRVEFDPKSTEFRKAIFQTPFWASKSVNNLARFSVIRADPWKKFIQRIVDSGVYIKTFDYTSCHRKELTVRVGQTLSIEQGVSEYKAFKRFKVNSRKKVSMPAFGVPMWDELFSPTFKEYFELGEKVVHVMGTQARVQGQGVKTFEEVKKVKRILIG